MKAGRVVLAALRALDGVVQGLGRTDPGAFSTRALDPSIATPQALALKIRTARWT